MKIDGWQARKTRSVERRGTRNWGEYDKKKHSVYMYEKPTLNAFIRGFVLVSH